MRAALLSGLNEKLEVRDDFVLDGPGPGEVRLRMVASGVCHSDLSFQNGTIPIPLPSVIGHEGAGEVIAIGEGVSNVAVGDPVIIAWTPPCGTCVCCLEHQPNLCMTGLISAATPHIKLGNDVIFGGTGTPTFAEETVIPAIAAIPIPRDVPLDLAALVGCGVTTGMGAAMNTAKVHPGSTVVVIGCGGVGISVIQGARVSGAATIVAVDPVAKKREWAQQFGATHAVAPDELAGLTAELTQGRGFDYAFEVVGQSETIRSAWEATRRGGTTVVVGVASMDQKVEFSAFELFYSEKRLIGSFYGSADVRTDFAKILQLWKSGKVDLENMVSQRIDLSEINEAFDAMQRGEVIRTVIEFS